MLIIVVSKNETYGGFVKYKNIFLLSLKAAYFVGVMQVCSNLYGSFDNAIHKRNLVELEKFLNRYSCSSEIEEQLSDDKIVHDFGPTFDGKFYVKDDKISRLVNAIRLQRFMQDNGITDIDIPQKCWSRKLQSVVASNIPGLTMQELKESGRKLTLEEVQKLARIIEETSLGDLYYRNLYLSVKNRLSLIDLEDRSFFVENGIIGKLWPLFDWPMEIEAQEWLTKRFLECREIENKDDRNARMSDGFKCNRKYDDPDINFNKVKAADLVVISYCSYNEKSILRKWIFVS